MCFKERILGNRHVHTLLLSQTTLGSLKLNDEFHNKRLGTDSDSPRCRADASRFSVNI